MQKACAICECEITFPLQKGSDFFCWNCFEEWKEDILAKKPWIMYLISLEMGRRRKKEFNYVYLDDGYDVSTDHELIRGKHGTQEEER